MKVIMANKGRKFFTILLIITLIIIIVLLGYLAYRFLSNYLIQKEASEAVDEFENSIITVSRYDLENDIFLGMPSVINRDGIKESVYVNLNSYEEEKLQHSVDVINEATNNIS